MAGIQPRSLLFIGNYMHQTRGSRAVSEDLSLRLESLGWQVTRASRRTNKVLRLADMLTAIWRRRADYEIAVIDVFSGSAFRFAESTAALLSLLHKPFVLILHGGHLPEFAHRHDSRVRRLFTGAAVVVAPSRYLLERMRPYRPDLRLIPNPISLDECPYVPRHTASPKLIWLRAYHHVYNLPMAIDAIDRLRHDFPHIHLTVVGPDKGDGARAAAEAEVARRNLQQHVSLQGAVPKDQVPACLNQADIFLNTTNIDNTPVSVLEALGCGLCIVSTNVGGIPYLLDDEADSLLVPPRDAAALASAVTRLLTDPALASRLSAAARAKAQTFDWQRVLPDWQRVLSSAALSRVAPSSAASRATVGD